MIGFAVSSATPEAAITGDVGTALLAQLRRTEALWRVQNIDPNDESARVWGCVENVALLWSAETSDVDPNPQLCVVQLVKDFSQFPDVPNDDLAFHTTDALGRPICYVSLAASGAGWVSAMSHEIAEARQNATCRILCPAPDGTSWDREVCDPLQGSDYTEPGTRYPVANVAGPRYFNLAMSGPFDIAGAITGAFQHLPEGYHDGSAGIVMGERVSEKKRAELLRNGVRGKLQRMGCGASSRKQ